MDRQLYEIRRDDEKGLLIIVHDRLDRKVSGTLWSKINSALGPARLERVCFDFKDSTGIDTSGVALLRILKNLCSKRNIDFTCLNLPEPVEQFMRYTEELSQGHREPAAKSEPDTLSQIGNWFMNRLHGAYLLVRFIGDCLAGLAWYIRNPHRFPLRLMLEQVQLVGSDAMPLVIFMSALMGMIMVFQGPFFHAGGGYPSEYISPTWWPLPSRGRWPRCLLRLSFPAVPEQRLRHKLVP